MQKIIDGLNNRFRKQTDTVDIVSEPTEENKKQYYMRIFRESKKILKSRRQMVRAAHSIPEDKDVVVFANLNLLETLSEQSYYALDDYIKSAKNEFVQEKFYRGVKRGEAIICAFTKECLDEEGYIINSDFLDSPSVVLYF